VAACAFTCAGDGAAEGAAETGAAAGVTANGALGAATGSGAGAAAAMVSGTSSSMKALIGVPTGRRALVPVMKKPAGAKTTADTPTAATPPAVPFWVKAPLRRIWRPFTVK
jgi:hypothetical protein